ncbi:MAG TPA: hypothetical protein VLG46_06860 [Anaerolineae bacterium]|nr:hypothetical protein [Anaerolineae bacterium]
MKESPSFGGRTEIETTQIKVHVNAYETPPIFWWGWPDDALPGDTTEMADQVEQAAQPLENNLEYAALYFVA